MWVKLFFYKSIVKTIASIKLEVKNKSLPARGEECHWFTLRALFILPPSPT
jgi:hypothetical protein